jgi:hypothetical protein
VGVKVAQTMYTHVSKCKNDKKKRKKKKIAFKSLRYWNNTHFLIKCLLKLRFNIFKMKDMNSPENW